MEALRSCFILVRNQQCVSTAPELERKYWTNFALFDSGSSSSFAMPLSYLDQAEIHELKIAENKPHGLFLRLYNFHPVLLLSLLNKLRFQIFHV